MDTDQLIKTLATDNERHEPSVGSVLTTALAVAAAVSHYHVLYDAWIPQRHRLGDRQPVLRSEISSYHSAGESPPLRSVFICRD
jgi:hypothetical protein